MQFKISIAALAAAPATTDELDVLVDFVDATVRWAKFDHLWTDFGDEATIRSATGGRQCCINAGGGTADAVAALAGGTPTVAAIEGFLSIQVALAAIDRLGFVQLDPIRAPARAADLPLKTENAPIVGQSSILK